MKKLLAILVLVLFGTTMYAQTNIFPTSGKVGIGTTTPTFDLHVTSPNNGTATSITVEKQAGVGGAQFVMADLGQNSQWNFKSANGGIFKIRDAKHTSDVMVFEAVPANAPTAIYLTAAGNLGIGTSTPGAKLAVNGTGTFAGKVKCNEIEVLNPSWPDFVFDAGYNLRPLSEVENFISLNKHLPDVPSAEAISTNGANLGELNATLLQKVEELTLYMIQLQKDNDALKARVSNLEK